MNAHSRYMKPTDPITFDRVSDVDRIISGVASVPVLNGHGYLVDPLGCKYELPLPLLIRHNYDKTVGQVIEAEITPTAVKFVARINAPTQPGAVKSLCDQSWQQVQEGLLTAVSAGFSWHERKDGPDNTLIITAWQWSELSLCPQGACPHAKIRRVSGAIPPWSKEQPRVVQLTEQERNIGRIVKLNKSDIEAGRRAAL